MRVLGVDPSTYTALALLSTDSVQIKLLHFEQAKGWKRLQLLQIGFHNQLEELKPDVAYVEGYNIRNKYNLILMAEIGTILRNALYQAGVEWWDVPPTVLKKWTTGKGTAKKSDMAVAAQERWQFVHPSDDAVDAYALARLGQSVVNGVHTPKQLKITHGHKLEG